MESNQSNDQEYFNFLINLRDSGGNQHVWSSTLSGRRV